VLRASITAEQAGIHSVTIVGRGFGVQARAVAKMLGVPDAMLAEYPGVLMVDSNEVFQEKVRGPLLDQIVALLGKRATALPAKKSVATSPVTAGTLDQVHEYFTERAWTDGLPIIPPTRDRIEAFLAHTDRQPSDRIGVLLPSNSAASVWSVAVNGVMAGCKPVHMPILLAAVEAICDPTFRIQDAGSTPGWEPLIILGGPIIRDLGFHFGPGALRMGTQPNTSVGRFLRLYMRNVAGLASPPDGVTDKATFGSAFNVVLAENEAVTQSLGWATYAADERHCAPGSSALTVMSVESVTPPIYTRGDTAEQHLQKIAEVYGGMVSHWTCCGITFGALHGLLALSPSVATVLAGAGLSKQDIRNYLYENCKIDMEIVHRYAADPGNERIYIDELVERRLELKVYQDAGTSGLVPVFPYISEIGIIVAGDPDRNQSRGFLNNHSQGVPVTRVIDHGRQGSR
jgi:hypothetical protein